MVILKIVFTEKEKLYVDKLAELLKFPISNVVSTDGYTIYLPQKAIIQKLYDCIKHVSGLSPAKRKLVLDEVMEQFEEAFPEGVVKK